MSGKTIEIQSIKNGLENIHGQGIKLYLDGKEATPDKIVKRFIREEKAVYMPDFVLDENGVLTQIRYDKVKDNQSFE